MRIALLKPQDPNLTGNNIIYDYFRQKDTFQPGSLNIYRLADLTLLTLAGRLPAGMEAIHHDEDVDGLLTGAEKFDLVYINAKSQQSPRAYEISRLFREHGVATVIGGTHVSAVPEDGQGRADTLILGEEDLAFDRMIADFRRAGRSGLQAIYRMEEFLNLNASPAPRYDLLNTKNYAMLPIQATRGCPHACRFCYSTAFAGKRLRHKPVAAVLAEIAAIKQQEPHPSLFFMDDNMLSDRQYAIPLLAALADTGVRWCTFTDISFAHDERILERLVPAGCSEVLIGFETVTPAAMNQVSEFKRRELAGYGDSIRRIQEAGIGVIGSFVVGFDEDTPAVFDHLLEFIETNMLHEISISILTPYPGTELFQRFLEDGRLTSLDYGRYSDLSWNVNFKPRQMTVEQIHEGIRGLLDRVYSPEMNRRRLRHFKDLVKRRLTRSESV